MKKIIVTFLTIILSLNSSFLFAQINLTIEGTVVSNSTSGEWSGVNIQRSVPTNLIYRNNSITSVNASGYMLQAGDEVVTGANNNLDGEVITGNKLVWNGTDAGSITHGLFTGHNKNVVIKYNYLDKVPMGIIRKSTNGMSNTSGGIAYNIVKNPVAVGGVVKGMNNVSIYNNTFYSNRSDTWRGLIDIYSNTDVSPSPASTGTKIKNNIFYTVSQIYNIAVLDAACVKNFESDYNVFYCESGTPVFNYLGSKKTFVQWQALGYDLNSVVVNPNFVNTVDFVPATRLNFGTDLGTAWQAGLSTTATWAPGVSPATASQNGTWQVGARVYNIASPVSPNYISSKIENTTPAVLEMSFSLDLANIIPPVSAFIVKVNSTARNVNSIVVSGSKVRLTLATPAAAGDIITVAYSKPSTNPLQSVSGGQVASISAMGITNNVTASTTTPVPNNIKMTIYPNPVHHFINIMLDNVAQDAGISLGIIRIFDISGKLFIEKMIETGVANVQFPIKLKPGFYAVVIFSGNLILSSQSIIVN